MLDTTKLEQQVLVLYGGDNGYRDRGCTVEINGEVVTVQVYQMYDYLPLNFDILMALSTLFRTKKVNVDKWSSSGCDTCDYGSRYQTEFTFNLSDMEPE